MGKLGKHTTFFGTLSKVKLYLYTPTFKKAVVSLFSHALLLAVCVISTIYSLLVLIMLRFSTLNGLIHLKYELSEINMGRCVILEAK